MLKSFLLVFLFCIPFIKVQSQSQGIGINIGATYINTNTGYIGGEYAYRIDPENWKGISVGAGTHYGSFNGDFKFIPEAHLTLSNTLFLAEFSITPHNINPSIGLNGMNTLRLKIGYSWKLGNENLGLKGVTFGINYLLGTKGFYDEISLK